ncbi:bifunctional phosphatidyl-N-methylethanolamine N-methyltransferase/phosphatidyl-N-dimethylethanolamine N-methyltransferase Ecym_3611 [Eremothecium cymbalariae DBVPG|uniref:Phosphatidyl-N-methylethanolamine N-methyltransferase n=1 Tax=Eremothecium cymbalariae (strain CBS 270.75 / DBVPG 7215 / KCTC 17166 / NRRL Y-17582) TaxID=931890 RepID=G8JQT8_ERECY|nr:Hypothetical protein Ecym_3611 [Eremothecium cymbalariae DBVPG\
MGIEDWNLNELLKQAVTDIDSDQQHFRLALFFIVFNPVFWNIVAYAEYRTHFLTKIAGGAHRGCYILAAVIFSLGVVRDYFFNRALDNQVPSQFLEWEYFRPLGSVFFGFGQLLVVTSMWQLGITGTYLGDYFGILMDEKVVAFPFNVCNNPMYVGSALSFLGVALYRARAAGVFLALLMNTMYSIALKFEEPFTAMVYGKRAEEKTKKSS